MGTNAFTVPATDPNGCSGTADFALVIRGLPSLKAAAADNTLLLTWPDAAFTLQSAPELSGPYTNIVDATSPYRTPFSGARGFYRLKSN